METKMIDSSIIFIVLSLLKISIVDATFFPTHNYGFSSSYYYGPFSSSLYCPTVVSPATTYYSTIIPTTTKIYRPVVYPIIYPTTTRTYYPIWRPPSFFYKFRQQNGTNATDYIYKSDWYTPFWKYQGAVQHFPKKSNETTSTEKEEKNDNNAEMMTEKESEKLIATKEKRDNKFKFDEIERESDPLIVNVMKNNKQKLKSKKIKKFNSKHKSKSMKRKQKIEEN